MSQTPVSDFVRHHYRHFNAAALVDAADRVDAGAGVRAQLALLVPVVATEEVGRDPVEPGPGRPRRVEAIPRGVSGRERRRGDVVRRVAADASGTATAAVAAAGPQ